MGGEGCSVEDSGRAGFTSVAAATQVLGTCKTSESKAIQPYAMHCTIPTTRKQTWCDRRFSLVVLVISVGHGAADIVGVRVLC